MFCRISRFLLRVCRFSFTRNWHWSGTFDAVSLIKALRSILKFSVSFLIGIEEVCKKAGGKNQKVFCNVYSFNVF